MSGACVHRAVALVVLVATSCSPHTVRTDPPPPVTVPEHFAAAPESAPPAPAPTPAAGAGSTRWWQGFGDPDLDALVDRALAGSLDLRAAWARLERAEAAARASGALWWPELTASLGAARNRTPVPSMIRDSPLPGVGRTSTSNQFSASLAAGYEIDLWGRVASLDHAADLDLTATRQDVEAAAVTVAAQVAETWYALIEQRAQAALVERQIASADALTDVVALRFREGLASAIDVYQQRQQAHGLRGTLPLVAAAARTLSHALHVQLGEPPGGAALPERATLPDLPPPPDVGVPSALLAERPDVRAARLRVTAQDHRIGAALADRFPALRISANTGFSAFDVTEFFRTFVYGVAANLIAPLFDGGRRAAEVDRQRALLRESLLWYGQITLRSFREVEDSIVLENRQRERLGHLDVQVELADATLREARARHAAGVTELPPVLTAEGALHQAESARLAARRLLLSHRIQLHRALGGRWTADLASPGDADVRRDGKTP
jgi:NodT family efflux transporter outer membrane factor (OMF) lipoprotein